MLENFHTERKKIKQMAGDCTHHDWGSKHLVVGNTELMRLPLQVVDKESTYSGYLAVGDR
jgi:hypothetical protein